MKGTVFEQVLGPKSAPEAFAGEPSFSMLCLRQLSSQAVLAEHASSPALGLSTFRSRVKSAAHIVLFIANSVSPNNRTTRRVGKMLFLLENVHCATAGDTEQNGFKRFTVARRAFITCFRRVMIIFAGSFQGNVKIVTCFVRQTKPFSLFCGAQSTLRFRVFPCKCQPNQS